MTGTELIGSRLNFTFYSPQDLKPFLPSAALPVFSSGEMVAPGFSVNVVFEAMPTPRVWHDGTTFFQTPGESKTAIASPESMQMMLLDRQVTSTATSATSC